MSTHHTNVTMTKGSPVTSSTCSSSLLEDVRGGDACVGTNVPLHVCEENVRDQLETMLAQEEGPYRCRDYLARAHAAVAAAAESSSSSSLRDEDEEERSGRRRRGSRLLKKKAIVDATSRAKMVEWCVRVSDFLGFDRTSVVAVTFSILDRYLDTVDGGPAVFRRRSYQLAALTAFYVAVKMCAREAMGPGFVAVLSRGEFDEENIVQSEAAMLRALGWRVWHTPTPADFLRRYFEILPRCDRTHFKYHDGSGDGESSSSVSPLFDCALEQVDLSTRDYFLSVAAVKPSVVAYAALLNAIFIEEGLGLGRRPARFLAAVDRIGEYIGMPSTAQMIEVRSRLWELAAESAAVPAEDRDDSATLDVSPHSTVVLTQVDKENDAIVPSPTIEGLVITVPSKSRSRFRRSREKRVLKEVPPMRNVVVA